MTNDSIDHVAEQQYRKDRRSLSFSHAQRYHRSSTSSSDEEEGSPVRNIQWFNNEDDEASRDSLSEFQELDVDDDETQQGRKRSDIDELHSRKRTLSNADANGNTNGQQNSGSVATTEKRAATKICRVCGDKAYSYNFSVVTCESCKAFFRRNANKEKDIRCPFNDNCDINIVSRRFCQRCRLKKCFAVGMKKEWIMSDEARREKKQRIQENRERRAERAHEEKQIANQQVTIQPNNSLIDQPTDVTMVQINQPAPPIVQPPPMVQPISNIIPSSVLPPLPQPSIISPPMPPVVPVLESSTNAMQQAIQAQQVQNAQILAAAASLAPPQCDTIADISNHIQTIQQAIGSNQPCSATNALVNANLNNQLMANQATPPVEQQIAAATQQLAAAQQAAQIAAAIQTTTVQSPISASSVSIAANLNQIAQVAQAVKIEQMHQQINAANIAAQRIADQQTQQLASAVLAVAASNQQSLVNQTAAEIVAAQPTITSGILAQPPMLPPPVPLVEPMPTLVPQPQVPDNSLVAVPKQVLINLVAENIENRQAQAQQQMSTPPLKCVCKCQCGRYAGTDMPIVDKVMSDMLTKQTNPIESMDCSSQQDPDCRLLSEDDNEKLGEILRANDAFWQQNDAIIDNNTTDAALRKLIRMASALYAFKQLSRPDQANLLKRGCASHFVLRSAMSMQENRSWENPNLSLSDTVIQFFDSLRPEWRSNRSIMLLLSALVIFDYDCPGLENRMAVLNEANRLKSILKRILFTLCNQQQQRTCIEYQDLINKLNVLQSLNNNALPQQQNGLNDSLRLWSAEVVEPLLSRELFEPHLMATNIVDTSSSMSVV